MSQLHCYVPDDIAKKLRAKAEQAHLPVSKYLALLIEKDVESQWPENYFELLGNWQGEPLERPIQGDYENRTSFE